MDRFHLNGRDKGISYQDALEFLGEVRAGISWNRFTALSIRYFDLFLNILNDTEDSRRYIEDNHFDRVFITEMIKKVFYRLHLNREDDHYLTLGLPRNASEEEIHRRWKALILLYHPDRNRDDEIASECAKRINESYSILKDPDKRSLYDRKLLNTFISKRDIKAKEGTRKIYRGMILSTGARRIISRSIKVSLFLIPIVVIIVFFFNQRTQVFDFYDYRKVDEKGNSEAVTFEDTNRAADKDRSLNNKETIHQKERQRTRLPSIRSESENQDETGQTYQKPVEKEPRETPVKPTISVQPLEPFNEEIKDHKDGKGRDSFSKGRNSDLSDVVYSQRESSIKTEQKKEEITQLSRLADLTERVNNFLTIYKRAYNNGDFVEFLSLYSNTAIENGMTYSEIKKAYREYFRGDRYNSIEINNVQIKEMSGGIIVSGRYRLYKLKEDRVISSKEGNIRWTLGKDGSNLKIVRSEYDRD